METVRILLITSSILMGTALGTPAPAEAASPPRVVFAKPAAAASLQPLYRDLVTAMNRLAALTQPTPAAAPVDPADDDESDEEEAEDTMIAANARVVPVEGS